MIDQRALLADLKAEVRSLEGDLRERSASEAEFATALKTEWQKARDAKRTAVTYETWLDDRVTQAAAAWILTTVFVRFCEDNGLIDLPYLAGPGERLAVAIERQQEFFQRHPEKTDRDWILAGVEALAASKVAAGLFNHTHNPMWTITPSHDAAKTLLTFWRKRGEDAEIVHDFTDPDWGTRFLGDLYQDLSEHAKKTYALLQTPEFVEEFILDYTLEPAIDEFGLDGLRVIDPTCGSGHFLLGAFRRLLKTWETKAPALDRWELISRVLSSVHGVDKNPFAAAIARFRLLVAAMKASDVTLLAKAPNFPLNVAVGDSLLHGRGGPGIQAELDLFGEHETHTYVTEDIHDYEKSVDILGIGTYHVVVGNPPYITVKDKQENDNYRNAYKSCSGKYALSVPFAERFFQLAIRGGLDGRAAGYVGQITANSFMKREFGKKVIEEFFPTIDLTCVVDTSGAYIPGHGIPTVILFGRRRWSRPQSTIRAVMGVRGEPSRPDDPACGLVWQAIVRQINNPGSGSEWISVGDIGRDRLAAHPWSLSGGGAASLMTLIESNTKERLHQRLNSRIGFAGFSANDEVFYFPRMWHKRHGTPLDMTRPLAAGKEIKCWTFEPYAYAIIPYNPDGDLLRIDTSRPWARQFWMAKRCMEELADFSGLSRRESGTPWWSWYHWISSRNMGGERVVFAKIATHNEATINRDSTVTNQHVFVVQPHRHDQEDACRAVLGTLNSSTACFWLKQVSHGRGNGGVNEGYRGDEWEEFYEFTGAKLQEFPMPQELPVEFGWELDGLASRLSAVEASAVCAKSVPSRDNLDTAHAEHGHIRARMIALQEELDWDVYHRYGLLSDTEAKDLIADPTGVPELSLGERAFEIVLARRKAAGEIDTQWFTRHGSVPIEVIPEGWPEPYRRVVAKRIQMIENRRDIALIERPECKRRWQSEPWEKKERAALRTWLLDRCEDSALWFENDGQGRQQPRPMTVNRLADKLRTAADKVSVARLLAGPDADLAEVLTDIAADEHVPCLAQQRYTEPGLRKRKQWERVWDMQRQEDRDDSRLDIPVPPKYTGADFLRTSYWRNRGKLDVPKERFVSYPGASPDGDSSLLLGWAGWDHREQAHALLTLIDERATRDGWDGERLKPLIAALAEVMPWVRQWHGDVDPEFGTSPAKAYDAFLDEQKLRYGFGSDDLDRWRPQKVGRGRRFAKPASADDTPAEPDDPQDEATP